MTQLRIGDMARLGGVSVRMLRHYHEIELFVPAGVDDSSGYRYYDSGQLPLLQRIATLRKVGVSLADIGAVVRSDDPVRLRTVLLARRLQLRNEVADAQFDIDRIDRHIADLEQGEPMVDAATLEVERKDIPARLVAQRSAVAESWAPSDIGPVIQPLYPELIAALESAGVEITGPSTAWYEDTAEGRVAVHATLTIGAIPEGSPAGWDFEVLELPSIEQAATTVHRGTMDDCDVTYQAMLQWLAENGLEPVGYSRELDIECGPDKEWITELQFAVRPRD